MSWWHWVGLGWLFLSLYYLEKIRNLLGTIMLFIAHQHPENPVAENFLEEHREKVAVLMKHPSLGRFIWWWRNQ